MTLHGDDSTHEHEAMDEFVKGAPADRLPTLIRTRRGYRVFDPALTAGTHYQIDDSGALVYTRIPAGATALGVLAIGLATALFLGDGVLSALLWLAAGLLLGGVLAGLVLSLIHLVDDPERRYKARTCGAAWSIDVTDPASREWALCARAERLAASRSWQTGRVDPERALPELLWAAVLGSERASAEVTSLCAGESVL